MKTVYVRFPNPTSSFGWSSKEYAYKTDLDLNVDDLAVVVACGEYKVVKVFHTESFVVKEAKAFIVCKVDTTAYEKLLENESKREELLNRMKEMAESRSVLTTFELIAEKDPEMKTLLDEYKSLG